MRKERGKYLCLDGKSDVTDQRQKAAEKNTMNLQNAAWKKRFQKNL